MRKLQFTSNCTLKGRGLLDSAQQQKQQADKSSKEDICAGVGAAGERLPEDTGPVGPSVVCCPLIWGLAHELQVDHILSAMPYAGADAVCACVSSTNDNNILVLQCAATNRQIMHVHCMEFWLA